jgi:hypothetical protein
VIKRLTTGLWYGFHQMTSVGTRALLKPDHEEFVFQALFQEAQKYKYLDSRGTECAYTDVIASTLTEIARPMQEGITVGGVVCHIVAILDAYDAVPLDRRVSVDRRQKDRRS